MIKRVFIVVDRYGRGWDKKIGATFYPHNFVTAESARDEARVCAKKYTVETYVIPASLIYKKPNINNPRW